MHTAITISQGIIGQSISPGMRLPDGCSPPGGWKRPRHLQSLDTSHRNGSRPPFEGGCLESVSSERGLCRRRRFHRHATQYGLCKRQCSGQPAHGIRRGRRLASPKLWKTRAGHRGVERTTPTAPGPGIGQATGRILVPNQIRIVYRHSPERLVGNPERDSPSLGPAVARHHTIARNQSAIGIERLYGEPSPEFQPVATDGRPRRSAGPSEASIPGGTPFEEHQTGRGISKQLPSQAVLQERLRRRARRIRNRKRRADRNPAPGIRKGPGRHLFGIGHWNFHQPARGRRI
mmetsp:Transcript_8659/g.18831  ORF Transcript_8659/g.18831 Transcript_8659/m.18831 type:complete len:290 (-) Transcript_8659:1514-2383(-)